MKIQQCIPTLPLVLLVMASCGDDSNPVVDAMPAAIDAQPQFSDGAGIVCPNAKASYGGTLFGPAATDDGSELFFTGNLEEESSDTSLQMRVGTPGAPTGSLSLPDSNWSVSLCIGPSDACTSELLAYSGTLQVNSSEGRLQASVNQVIFVDNLATPTCSAALSQSSIDVAISGPP